MGSLFVKPLSFTVVSANQNTLAPATNANLDEPGLVWRSSNLTTVNIILDMGATPSYDTVALVGTNLRAGDTVQVRTGSTNTGIGSYAGTALPAFSGVLPTGSTSKAIYKLGSVRTERYVRIDIVSTANPDTFTSVQRVVVGQSLALSDGAGVDLGHEITFVDQSTPYNGPGWTSYDVWQVLKKMKLTVSLVPDSDFRTDWYGFLQTVGSNKAFLVVPDDTQPANWQVESIFGRLTQNAQATGTIFGVRRFDLEITATAQ